MPAGQHGVCRGQHQSNGGDSWRPKGGTSLQNTSRYFRYVVLFLDSVLECILASGYTSYTQIHGPRRHYPGIYSIVDNTILYIVVDLCFSKIRMKYEVLGPGLKYSVHAHRGGGGRGRMVARRRLTRNRRYDVARDTTPRAQRLSIDHHVVCSAC